jgi:hypothetical protein
MPGDAAELESLATALAELTERIVVVADRTAGTARDSIASDLYEVERGLRAAVRKLNQVVRDFR